MQPPEQSWISGRSTDAEVVWSETKPRVVRRMVKNETSQKTRQSIVRNTAKGKSQ